MTPEMRRIAARTRHGKQHNAGRWEYSTGGGHQELR